MRDAWAVSVNSWASGMAQGCGVPHKPQSLGRFHSLSLKDRGALCEGEQGYSPAPRLMVIPTKLDLLAGVQRANNDTLERDMDCLFQSCPSLDAQWYSTNPAHPHGLSLLLFIHRNSESVTFQAHPSVRIAQ